MQLTPQEQEMLRGDNGYAIKKSMEILVALGEAFAAEKLIPIKHVHIPTGAVLVGGDAWVDFVEEIADSGISCTTRATTNPASTDPILWQELGIPQEIAEQQARHSRNLQRIGALLSYTCAPYQIGFLPQMGEDIVSGESSNIAFMNSVLGVRTNRAGAPVALAAALTGRAPYYGMHLRENRKGDILISVKARLTRPLDYGVLGYIIGEMTTGRVPVFEGLSSPISNESLKQLSAALNTSGAITMFHIVGVTPEAPSLEEAFQGKEPKKLIEITASELQETQRKLSTARGNKPNWIIIGCPHASIWEIKEIAEVVREKKIRPGVEFWVCTAEPIRAYAQRLGYQRILKMAGIKIICDTCPANAPSKEIAKRIGNPTTIATNSAKMAHYMDAQWDIPVLYGSLNDCLAAAINGKWGESFE